MVAKPAPICRLVKIAVHHLTTPDTCVDPFKSSYLPVLQRIATFCACSIQQALCTGVAEEQASRQFFAASLYLYLSWSICLSLARAPHGT